jgi:hypothetical protein
MRDTKAGVHTGTTSVDYKADKSQDEDNATQPQKDDNSDLWDQGMALTAADSQMQTKKKYRLTCMTSAETRVEVGVLGLRSYRSSRLHNLTSTPRPVPPSQ